MASISNSGDTTPDSTTASHDEKQGEQALGSPSEQRTQDNKQKRKKQHEKDRKARRKAEKAGPAALTGRIPKPKWLNQARAEAAHDEGASFSECTQRANFAILPAFTMPGVGSFVLQAFSESSSPNAFRDIIEIVKHAVEHGLRFETKMSALADPNYIASIRFCTANQSSDYL